MDPTPSKATAMIALGSNVVSKSGTSPAWVKWASMASMPTAVLLVLCALARAASEVATRRSDCNMLARIF